MPFHVDPVYTVLTMLDIAAIVLLAVVGLVLVVSARTWVMLLSGSVLVLSAVYQAATRLHP